MQKFNITISKHEVMRYAMCHKLDEQSEKQLLNAIQCIQQSAKQQFHTIILPKDDEWIQKMCQQSKALASHLSECHHVIIMGVTIGVGVDRMLRQLQNKDMVEALWYNAAANTYIEALCDEINDYLKIRYHQQQQYLTDRYSCGYQDFALTWQKEIVERLDGAKKIGLYVNESMMLTPEKSVTALIGVSDIPQKAKIRGCKYCDRNGKCEYQKGGLFCE